MVPSRRNRLQSLRRGGKGGRISTLFTHDPQLFVVVPGLSGYNFPCNLVWNYRACLEIMRPCSRFVTLREVHSYLVRVMSAGRMLDEKRSPAPLPPNVPSYPSRQMPAVLHDGSRSPAYLTRYPCEEEHLPPVQHKHTKVTGNTRRPVALLGRPLNSLPYDGKVQTILRSPNLRPHTRPF